MRKTQQTRFVTDGKIVIRLGFYAKGDGRYDKGGTFYGCRDYPKGAASHYTNGKAGRIFGCWLLDPEGYMRNFTPIRRGLLSKAALKALERNEY